MWGGFFGGGTKEVEKDEKREKEGRLVKNETTQDIPVVYVLLEDEFEP